MTGWGSKAQHRINTEFRQEQLGIWTGVQYGTWIGAQVVSAPQLAWSLDRPAPVLAAAMRDAPCQTGSDSDLLSQHRLYPWMGMYVQLQE